MPLLELVKVKAASGKGKATPVEFLATKVTGIDEPKPTCTLPEIRLPFERTWIWVTAETGERLTWVVLSLVTGERWVAPAKNGSLVLVRWPWMVAR